MFRICSRCCGRPTWRIGGCGPGVMRPGRCGSIARCTAFMLFIVLNGTVVFESGPIRWAGCLGLAYGRGVVAGGARRGIATVHR